MSNSDHMTRERRKSQPRETSGYIGSEYLAPPAQPPPEWMENRDLLPKRPPTAGRRP